MVAIYCRARHGGTDEPCEECRDLIAYARKRLAACPFQQDKPTCGRCRIHCYKPEAKAKIREVMRYAGPRMLWHHPLLAIRHLCDGRRKAPPAPDRSPARQKD